MVCHAAQIESKKQKGKNKILQKIQKSMHLSKLLRVTTNMQKTAHYKKLKSFNFDRIRQRDIKLMFALWKKKYYIIEKDKLEKTMAI